MLRLSKLVGEVTFTWPIELSEVLCFELEAEPVHLVNYLSKQIEVIIRFKLND